MMASGYLSTRVMEVASPVDVDAFYAALQKHDQVNDEQWKDSETRWLNWIAVAIAMGVEADIVRTGDASGPRSSAGAGRGTHVIDARCRSALLAN